ncbi:hypothetical protein BFJ71_g16256 [Fusarium oxysporum]|nr:hypothetical protein BFJ71_g16256 [Fusarium oxysporum]
MIEFVRASKTGCGMSYGRIFQALSQDRSEYAIRYASAALAWTSMHSASHGSHAKSHIGWSIHPWKSTLFFNEASTRAGESTNMANAKARPSPRSNQHH